MTTETEYFSEYTLLHTLPLIHCGAGSISHVLTFSIPVQKLLGLKVTKHLHGAAIVCSDPVVAREVENLTCTEDLTAALQQGNTQTFHAWHCCNLQLPLNCIIKPTAEKPLQIYSGLQEGSMSHCSLTVPVVVESKCWPEKDGLDSLPAHFLRGRNTVGGQNGHHYQQQMYH